MKISTLFAVARSVATDAFVAGGKTLFNEIKTRTQTIGLTADEIKDIMVSIDEEVTTPWLANGAVSTLRTLWTAALPEETEAARDVVNVFVKQWEDRAGDLASNLTAKNAVAAYKGGYQISKIGNKAIIETTKAAGMTKTEFTVVTAIRSVENFDAIIEDTLGHFARTLEEGEERLVKVH